MATLTQEDISLAKHVQEKYGVPASVVLAQYITESGAGTSNIYRNSYNGFGITGKNPTTGASYTSSNGRRWRAYSSKAESFFDYGALVSSGQYATATANATTPEEFLAAIQPIYAPDSDGNTGYVALATSVINSYNLKQYDSDDWTSGGTGGTVTATTTTTDSGGVFDSVIGWVVKALAVFLILALAVVFFMQAFDISIPTPGGIVKDVIA